MHSHEADCALLYVRSIHLGFLCLQRLLWVYEGHGGTVLNSMERVSQEEPDNRSSSERMVVKPACVCVTKQYNLILENVCVCVVGLVRQYHSQVFAGNTHPQNELLCVE